MLSLIVAAGFALMLLAPCIVAQTAGSSEDSQ